MGFIVIPAIDLRGGKCVRLSQGRDESAVEYSADPVATARDWAGQGAQRLHIVNLDGAFGRASRHLEILSLIRRDIPAVLEYGGGLRTIDDMESALTAGADKLVLGTVALEQPDVLREALRRFGGERLVVALDSAGGRVATHGWLTVTELDVVEAARGLVGTGVQEILATEIGRDGMLSGPDLSLVRRLAGTGVSLLASGGLSSEDDLRALLELGLSSITGVIVGRALYEGRVSLQGLLRTVQEYRSDAA